MIASIYSKLCGMSPRFNKFSKRVMYQFMAGMYQKRDWTFMNYGYEHLDPATPAPALSHEDEPNRFCIQLYHHVAGAISLLGAKVLEVGSGRGGGAAYIKRYLNPRLMVGVDFSPKAVSLCNRTHIMEGLSFVPGDAGNLPFDDASFDAVVNVESSHCYPNMDTFLAEVRRILRPGGHFLFADFRDQEDWDTLHQQLEQTGMQCVRRTDITENVVAALDADHERKLVQIKRGVPRLLINVFQEFAGSKGTRIYRRFQNKATLYYSFVLQKTGA